MSHTTNTPAATTHATCACVVIDGVTIVIVAGCATHDHRTKPKTYEVTVSATGFYRATVTANSPEDAIAQANRSGSWQLDLGSMVADDDYEAEELDHRPEAITYGHNQDGQPKDWNAQA